MPRAPGHSFLYEGNAGELQQVLSKQSFGPRFGNQGLLQADPRAFERRQTSEYLIALAKLFVGDTKLRFRDANSYAYSPGASSFYLESPDLRFNENNRSDVICGANTFDVLPEVDGGSGLGDDSFAYLHLKLTGLKAVGGKVTKYNAINTVGGGVPSLIALVDSTGLTANVAAADLLAAGSVVEGYYRINVMLVCTTAASVSSTMPNAQIVYTDKDSNTSVTLDVSPILAAAGLGQSGLLTANAVGTVFSGVVVVYAKAGVAIQYKTVNYASTAAGMTYALRIRLEAL